MSAIRVLSIVHQQNAGPGVFGEVAAEARVDLDEWNIAAGAPPRLPPESYDAVMVFGADAHPDEHERFPWLREEESLLRRLVEERVPVLGVCLGGELLAKALGARVGRAREPEIGWYDVELTDHAAGDSIFRELPREFPAFEWHSYEFGLPPGAVPLARSASSLQAFRGDGVAWGVQFHAEVTKEIALDWLRDAGEDPDAERIGFDRGNALAETEAKIGDSMELGKAIALAFLSFAAGSARR